MTPDAALAEIALHSLPGKADEMARYHKVVRPYLGVANPVIDTLCRQWRTDLTLDARLALAGELWDSNVHEGRLAAAKLLTQARIRPDDAAWAMIESWVPEFDGWAVADHAASAGAKRLIADPARLDSVETWTTSPHVWTKRAALVMTLPWTKQNHPKPAELDARHRILGWAAGYVVDHNWFIQKSVAWWLRDLSRHDPHATQQFLTTYGDAMKPWAVREAARHLPDQLA